MGIAKAATEGDEKRLQATLAVAVTRRTRLDSR